MRFLLVVNNPSNWPLKVDGVEVVSSRQYLTDPAYSTLRHVRVFNLCRSYAYQSMGYYVSLLAEARGHRPQPDIVTLQDMKSSALSRVLTDELDRLIQSTLRTIKSERFELSIYFGKTLAKRDQRLGQRLFSLFPSPLLRAQFVYRRKRWQWQGIRPISSSEIPETHRLSMVAAAETYFARKASTRKATKRALYDMAILVDPDEPSPPSDPKAIDRFLRAAKRHQVAAELITRDDHSHIGEYDALFIRATTYVNHFTFRFARRAEAEGLAVIDDPVSITRCTNKVFLAERLAGKRIATPSTEIVHRDNIDVALENLGLPMVLKAPDSSFSKGVIKVSDEAEYREQINAMLEDSDLVVAQAFTPTDYDWRVGVLDGKPLYACRYFMAKGHWQIINHDAKGGAKDGVVETLAVEDAPTRVINTALRATRLIGNGLYGVDIKQHGNKITVIEINDNPSIDAGFEDKVLGAELYDRIMQSFVARIEQIRKGDRRRG